MHLAKFIVFFLPSLIFVYIQDFAQVSVLEVYWQYHGALPSPYVSTCMENQFAYIKSLDLYANATLFGETCAISDDWTSVLYVFSPCPIYPDCQLYEVDTYTKHIQP